MAYRQRYASERQQGVLNTTGRFAELATNVKHSSSVIATSIDLRMRMRYENGSFIVRARANYNDHDVLLGSLLLPNNALDSSYYFIPQLLALSKEAVTL